MHLGFYSVVVLRIYVPYTNNYVHIIDPQRKKIDIKTLIYDLHVMSTFSYDLPDLRGKEKFTWRTNYGYQKP